jgi:hypothetical protein
MKVHDQNLWADTRKQAIIPLRHIQRISVLQVRGGSVVVGDAQESGNSGWQGCHFTYSITKGYLSQLQRRTCQWFTQYGILSKFTPLLKHVMANCKSKQYAFTARNFIRHKSARLFYRAKSEVLTNCGNQSCGGTTTGRGKTDASLVFNL